jgi:hypothetical protein
VYFEYGGDRKTLKEWGQTAAVSYKTFESRIGAGWNFEDAYTTPKISEVDARIRATEAAKDKSHKGVWR